MFPDGGNIPRFISPCCRIRSTQRAGCCQRRGCTNICDGELPQLAAADASCVDPWICPSQRSAGPQCCAAKRADCHLIKISLCCHASCSVPTPGLLGARGIKGREARRQRPMAAFNSPSGLEESLERRCALCDSGVEVQLFCDTE